ncbi:MAG: PAS domain S-box protein, partial [Coriobacteriia bacterium]
MADAQHPQGEEVRLQGEADALRRRAEELLDGIAGGDSLPEDAATVLHELRVHQIELEMQNEELRATQHTLQVQHEKYYDLFDSAPVGYLTVNSKGMVTEANLTAVHLLGVERQLLVGQPFSAFVETADRDEHYLRVRAMEKTSEPQSFDLQLCRASHRPDCAPERFWAHLEARPRHDDDGEGLYRLAFTDITERKQTEAALAARLNITEYALDHSLDEIIQKALDEIEAATGSSVGFFHFVDEDQKSLLLQTWSTNTLATQCTAEGKSSHYAVDEAGVWADCLREGRPI